ncbi:MAG: hypothetical protein HDR03_03580 [Lachnospiraceae bacterium]|nr:hypothetical protein [Lachnospiraceae bacterium]
MKIITELVKYQYKQYVLSTKYLVPLIGLLAVFQVMYSIMPIDIVINFALMSLILFIIMVGVGMTCQRIEPEVSEQIIILRIQSERKYYIGQVIFFAVLSGMFAFLSLCYPIINHFLNGKMLFTRNVQPSDIIGGFLLMFACSFVGSMMGEIFSPRVIRKHEAGIILTIFCALISLVKIGIVDEIPILKYILWIVPPVSDVVKWFMTDENFQMVKVLEAFSILMVYGCALAIIKVEVSRIRKF